MLRIDGKCCLLVGDDCLGGYLVIWYFIDFGYWWIGLIVGFNYVLSVMGCVEGYWKVMVEVGFVVDFEWIRSLIFGIEFGGEVVCQFMVLKESLFVIFVINDNMVIGVFFVLSWFGLLVLNDILLVGYNDIFVVSYLLIFLMLVKIFFEQIVIVVFEFLFLEIVLVCEWICVVMFMLIF